MTLQESFDQLMNQAWPEVPRDSQQYQMLEQAFFAGCMVVHIEYTNMGPKPADRRLAHAEGILKQLDAYRDKMKQFVVDELKKMKDKPPKRPPRYGNN